MDFITVRINRQDHERLTHLGMMGDTLGKVIGKLINHYESCELIQKAPEKDAEAEEPVQAYE